jgi:hypothetical protein
MGTKMNFLLLQAHKPHRTAYDLRGVFQSYNLADAYPLPRVFPPL